MKNYEGIIEWIHTQKSNMIHLTEKWSNVNSGSDNLIGLKQMLKLLIQSFSALEGDLSVISLPSNPFINSKGNYEDFFSGQALLITKRPEAPIQVLLGGHMDTVYPATSFFQKVTIDNDKMNGPGVGDMKGGLVILLTTLLAFEQYEHREKIGWQILITPDEEIGSICSRALHVECAKKHLFGMIFEPAFSDGMHASGRKGSLNFSLISKGKSAHAGRDFHLGKNAIIALMKVLLKIDKLNNRESKITLNIGKIEGGTSANTIPDLAVSTCNLRVEDHNDIKELKKKIQNIIKVENEQEGSDIDYFTLSEREPKLFDKKEEYLFTLFKKSANDLNMPFEWKPTGGVCDGNIWSNVGLPTVDTLGPIASGIHSLGETIELNSLVDSTLLCTSTLIKIASGELSLSKLIQDDHEK